MTKKAANTETMNNLHDKLAKVFIKVLEGYETRMDAAESGELEAELLAALAAEPSPAMLSAVAKFLKDNDISYDDGAVEELNAVEQSLKARREKRGNLTVLSELRAVENG